MPELLDATPFDDVFKTILHDASRLVIPFVNEVFGKNYDLNEEVHFENTEFLDLLSGTEEKKTFADSVFTIGDDPTRYHIECQTNADSTIVIRIFEYDTHIARIHSWKEEEKIIFRFPASAIFYLRKNRNLPKKYHPARIEFPDGIGIDFAIPVIHMKDYTLESLFSKDLYLMLPFYLFNLEKMVKKKQGNQEAVNEVNSALRQILDKLQADCESKKITNREYQCLKAMIQKVGENLMSPYEDVVKEVKSMGGKVLEYEAQRIYNEAEAIGEAKGEAKGETKGRTLGQDEAMDLVSQLVMAGNYEELTRMAQDREYSRQKIRMFREG